MTNYSSDIWAITAYYNPIHYSNRYNNYKIFKERLIVPILTVQLSEDYLYDLNERDANILINVHSTSVLWHKERLLNIAIKHLPKHVKYVAWLDCDIIFESITWPVDTKILLEENNLVQLFSHLFDLQPNELPVNNLKEKVSGYGIAYLKKENILVKEDFLPSTTVGMRRGLFGLAWAAKRNIIEKFGFYDAMIVGSGDRALACAAYGRFQDAIDVTKMSELRIKHYLRWGRKFFDLMKGKVTNINGEIFHLWHGDLSNRKYIERHWAFANYDFDPDIDLILNEDECWEWKDRDNQMHLFIKDYLKNRHEDGQHK